MRSEVEVCQHYDDGVKGPVPHESSKEDLIHRMVGDKGSTLSVWIKLQYTSPSPRLIFEWADEETTDVSCVMRVREKESEIEWEVRKKKGYDDGQDDHDGERQSYFLHREKVPYFGRWCHIAMVTKTSSLEIYVNGRKTKTEAFDLPVAQIALELFRQRSILPRKTTETLEQGGVAHGKLHEKSEALSQDQISEIFTKEITSMKSGSPWANTCLKADDSAAVERVRDLFDTLFNEKSGVLNLFRAAIYSSAIDHECACPMRMELCDKDVMKVFPLSIDMGSPVAFAFYGLLYFKIHGKNHDEFFQEYQSEILSHGLTILAWAIAYHWEHNFLKSEQLLDANEAITCSHPLLEEIYHLLKSMNALAKGTIMNKKPVISLSPECEMEQVYMDGAEKLRGYVEHHLMKLSEDCVDGLLFRAQLLYLDGKFREGIHLARRALALERSVQTLNVLAFGVYLFHGTKAVSVMQNLLSQSIRKQPSWEAVSLLGISFSMQKNMQKAIECAYLADKLLANGCTSSILIDLSHEVVR
eukprot:TRINITY_DN678_c2_g1_i2.p1 TRINITY_DN678_c2_g1~~TRINITY_DN678_c2_g1_i2.p1  ORF type:complete len:528 (-),score=117.22 TRINITY_DN678_c2_g1_i2:2612-4195(-)